MSIDRVVFRTTDQRVLDEFTLYQKEHRAWQRRLRKLKKELDPTKKREAILSTGGFSSSETFIGLSLVSSDYGRNAELPTGWRADRKRGVLLPHKGTPEGKAIAAKIANCQPPKTIRQRLVGMPHGDMHGLTWRSPGIALREEGAAAYVTWPAPAPSKVDPEVWAQIPLSHYYALVEQEEAEGTLTK